MGIRKYKPTTPGLRGMTVSTFEEITTSTPEKSLTVTLKKHAGRNNRGKITVRHHGGGTELIIADEYDFILTYNANFDDTQHLTGPESAEALAEIRFNCRTFCMFNELIKTHWSHHNVLIGTGMDHGCHANAEGLGEHSDDTPEDRNIVHHYRVYPGN